MFDEANAVLIISFIRLKQSCTKTTKTCVKKWFTLNLMTAKPRKTCMWCLTGFQSPYLCLPCPTTFKNKSRQEKNVKYLCSTFNANSIVGGKLSLATKVEYSECYGLKNWLNSSRQFTVISFVLHWVLRQVRSFVLLITLCVRSGV